MRMIAVTSSPDRGQHRGMRSWSARVGTVLGAAAATAAVLLAATVTAPPQAVGVAAPPVGTGVVTGLWPMSFKAHQTAQDCGRWKLDPNGFCVANDSRDGLEIGVRFQTSRKLQIIGVRVYRYDTATITGSLWDSSGTLLAHGTFAPGPADAWQNMTFATPVTIVPGETYVASYFTPRTKYAFSYQYFADSGRTVGPITALRSTNGSPNGVHCYDDAACGSFPVRGYRNSSYWVTPLWLGSQTSAAAPRVVSIKHARGAATPTVRITFSKAMRRSTLNHATVRLLRRGKPVATRLTYQPAQRRLVLAPRGDLLPRAKYRVEVTTRVRDTTGRRLDQDAGRTGLQGASGAFRAR